MAVRHLCTRSVDTISPDESVWVAAARMHQRGVGALVVTNDMNEPIGILTDRDIVQRVVAKRLDQDETAVEAVMTRQPVTIDDLDTIEIALRHMRDGKFRRLPVVNDEGKVVGVLTLDDVLMSASQQWLLIGQILESETPRAAAAEPVAIGDDEC